MSYKYITQHDSPNYTPAAEAQATYGMKRAIEGITIHWWGDPKTNPLFDSIWKYLCRAGGNTSAHFVATGTGRQVACIVNPGDVAWHSGSAWGNARTIGIELDPRARPEDYDVAAELVADIRSAYGDVPIYWHSYFTPTACPGRWDPDKLDRLSYTKRSAAEWGKGGNKVPTTTRPPVTPPKSPKPATPVLYRLYKNGKQIAAYGEEHNAFKGYVNYGSSAVIRLNGADVTQDLINKYRTPSPTTKNQAGVKLPDSGKPVTDKQDYAPALPVPSTVLPEQNSPDVLAVPPPVVMPDVLDTAITLGQEIEKHKQGDSMSFWQKHFSKEKILLDLAAVGTAVGGIISWFIGHHELFAIMLNVLSGIIFGGNRFKGK